MTDRIAIRAHQRLAEQLSEWREVIEKNADSQTREALTYAAVRAAIDRVIRDPEHAGNQRLTGDLFPVCRIKLGPKTRDRLFYIVNVEKRQARLLFLGYRREGHRKDAYEVFRKRLKRGDYDTLFREIGAKLPKAR